jgi:hypothetical protein
MRCTGLAGGGIKRILALFEVDFNIRAWVEVI